MPATYAVVCNDEEQYSVWGTHAEIPAGWRREGFTGSREDCLDHIEDVWTDMRPASLRRVQDRTAETSAGAHP